MYKSIIALTCVLTCSLANAISLSQDRFELMSGEDASSLIIKADPSSRLLKTQVVTDAGPCKSDDLLVSPSSRIIPENTEQIVRMFFRGQRVSACDFVILISVDPRLEKMSAESTNQFGLGPGHGVRVLVQPKMIQIRSRAMIINNKILAIQSQGNAYDQVKVVEINKREYPVNWRLKPGKPQPFELPAPAEGKIRFKTKFQAWIPVR